jgi:hypothetical protein
MLACLLQNFSTFLLSLRQILSFTGLIPAALLPFLSAVMC